MPHLACDSGHDASVNLAFPSGGTGGGCGAVGGCVGWSSLRGEPRAYCVKLPDDRLHARGVQRLTRSYSFGKLKHVLQPRNQFKHAPKPCNVLSLHQQRRVQPTSQLLRVLQRVLHSLRLLPAVAMQHEVAQLRRYVMAQHQTVQILRNQLAQLLITLAHRDLQRSAPFAQLAHRRVRTKRHKVLLRVKPSRHRIHSRTDPRWNQVATAAITVTKTMAIRLRRSCCCCCCS
mmetsp:Transcript_2519/g.5643  ORF Transcript_2519/g.5643 Transcript_2519/m.5643 type:complete len:231 (-) Transcript_2519:784-1476(-)